MFDSARPRHRRLFLPVPEQRRGGVWIADQERALVAQLPVLVHRERVNGADLDGEGAVANQFHGCPIYARAGESSMQARTIVGCAGRQLPVLLLQHPLQIIIDRAHRIEVTGHHVEM